MRNYQLNPIPKGASLEEVIEHINGSFVLIEQNMEDILKKVLDKFEKQEDELKNFNKTINNRLGSLEIGMNRLLADLDERQNTKKQLLNDSKKEG